MSALTRETRTTCPYCGVGCGLIVGLDEHGSVVVRGDSDHPANYGRVCSKGRALGETTALKGRLLHPLVDGEEVDWDSALDRAANSLREVIDEHGPESVAFYLSGQLLTEDYYVANKLAKGFIGTANVDTNSRLCMSSTVAAHSRALGGDLVPACYDDLEAARLWVFAGSNAAWCHPVIYQRIQAAKEADPTKKVVVIDPRRTATCELADLHLPLRPATDALLWNGLLAWMSEKGAVDYGFLEAHTRGFGEALSSTRRREGIARVASACGLVPEEVERFYELFTQEEQVVTLYSQGVHQSTSGTDKINAILNCHLLSGRIGKEGAGPFSLTGQPNAMGGREVGGLASVLAAHMPFTDPNIDRVGRFWKSPSMAKAPGLKTLDLFDAIDAGKIKAVWIAGTNPAVSLPNADHYRDALARCPTVIVSDCFAWSDTVELADIVLPALAWGEKSGTVTNSERSISRQRAFLDPPGQARADWSHFCEVAKRLGYSGFDYGSAVEIFREHAALSGFENTGERLFDISALAALDDGAYEALDPVQWPVAGSRKEGTPRLFEDGKFPTDDGRARFIAVDPRPAEHGTNGEFPLILNTGRIRDHWHTMTRTGRSATLSAHLEEPFVEVHPIDADAYGLDDDMLCELTSPWGKAIARVKLFEGQRRESVFMPIHWSGAWSSHGRVGAVVQPATDPLSGQPESKHTPVQLRAKSFAWEGFALRRDEGEGSLEPPQADWWVRCQGKEHLRDIFASDERPTDLRRWVHELLGKDEGDEWLELEDEALGRYRAARIGGGRLLGCVFIGSARDGEVERWLASLFGAGALSKGDRMALLSGKSPTTKLDEGRTVCTCHSVGEKRLQSCIRAGASTVAQLGKETAAGTLCGSCVPELQALIELSR